MIIIQRQKDMKTGPKRIDQRSALMDQVRLLEVAHASADSEDANDITGNRKCVKGNR